MSRKNDIFRIKIEHEEIPITDIKVKGIKEFDNVVEGVRRKFGGKK